MRRTKLLFIIILFSECAFSEAYISGELLNSKKTASVEFGYSLNTISTQFLDTLYEEIQDDTELSAVADVYLVKQNSRRDSQFIDFKYGFSDTFEASAQVSQSKTESEYVGIYGEKNSNDASYSSINVGFNWEVYQGDTYPTVVFLLDNSFGKSPSESFEYNSSTIGFSFYNTFDPIALSSTISYTRHKDKSIGQFDFQRGDVLSLQANAIFSLNSRVIIEYGVDYQRTGVDTIDTIDVTLSTDAFSLRAGIQLEAMSGIFGVRVNHDTSSYNGTTLSLSYLRRFSL